MTYTYNVYQNGAKIDTVFDEGADPAEVRHSLINHDGYDHDITVRRCWKTWYIIQSHWGSFWEDTCFGEDYADARQLLRDYRDNQPQVPHRLIKRREQV